MENNHANGSSHPAVHLLIFIGPYAFFCLLKTMVLLLICHLPWNNLLDEMDFNAILLLSFLIKILPLPMISC